MGVLSSECESRKNPPGIQLLCPVAVNLPAGPNGLCLMSPVDSQVPVKYSSFFTSGPGVGLAGVICAATIALEIKVATRTVPKRFNISTLLRDAPDASRNRWIGP